RGCGVVHPTGDYEPSALSAVLPGAAGKSQFVDYAQQVDQFEVRAYANAGPRWFDWRKCDHPWVRPGRCLGAEKNLQRCVLAGIGWAFAALAATDVKCEAY